MKGITPKQALRGGSEFAGKLLNSDLGSPEFQGGVEDLAKMDAGMEAAVEAFVSAMRNPSANSIIAERVDKNTVRLRLLNVNHDDSVEEMVKGLPYINSNLTSVNFPKCHNGKTGTEEVELFLYRPVPKGESWSHKKVEEAIEKAGFISADLPELAVLKDYADELWEADIRYYITALGENSRWQDPRGYVLVAFLRLFPGNRRFDLDWLASDWGDGGWFVVRRK